MNISADTAARITVALQVQETATMQDVLAQVNCALRQRAQILQRSDNPQLQSLAENMQNVRAEIVQVLADRLK